MMDEPTLRDLYALVVLHALMSGPDRLRTENDIEQLPSVVFAMADRMLAQRNKR